ncbi:hypothetical protein CC2G_010815 [Coprinopsis cinerea AmutBmut pab1-1]|nr:hypothetical protein CC2G_010815 [Coprinopsis cinerea AmutBmut pab1-1]
MLASQPVPVATQFTQIKEEAHEHALPKPPTRGVSRPNAAPKKKNNKRIMDSGRIQGFMHYQPGAKKYGRAYHLRERVSEPDQSAAKYSYEVPGSGYGYGMANPYSWNLYAPWYTPVLGARGWTDPSCPPGCAIPPPPASLRRLSAGDSSSLDDLRGQSDTNMVSIQKELGLHYDYESLDPKVRPLGLLMERCSSSINAKSDALVNQDLDYEALSAGSESPRSSNGAGQQPDDSIDDENSPPSETVVSNSDWDGATACDLMELDDRNEQEDRHADENSACTSMDGRAGGWRLLSSECPPSN